MMKLHQTGTACVLLSAWLFCVPTHGAAVDPEVAPVQDQSARQVVEEIHQSARLPGGDSLNGLEREPVIVWVPRLFLGIDDAYSGEGVRYLALRLTLANTTRQPVRLERKNISLRAGQETFHIGENPDGFRQMPLQVDRAVLPQSQLMTPEEIVVGPGKALSFWCVYTGFGTVPALPQFELHLEFDDSHHVQLDLNAQQRARLGLEQQLLGPGQSLAALRIHGQLNTLNAADLGRTIENLAERGTERLVVEWAPGAAAIDDMLIGWLIQSTSVSGRTNPLYSFLPSLSVVRKLLLARLPEGNEDAADWDEYSQRVFDSPAEAAAAALEEVVQRLDTAQLMQELRTGHAWSRQAILKTGGGRLGREALPLLLELADPSEPALRDSALIALGNQTDPEARDRLVTFALGDDPRAAEAALTALLRSEQEASQSAVKTLLDHPQLGIPPATVVSLLTQHFRAEWQEHIMSGLASEDAEVRMAVYRSLQQVGHPRLVQLCTEGLQDSSAEVREICFRMLAEQSDVASERAAVDYALKLLEAGTTSEHLLSLIHRTREPRAAGPLMKLLDNRTGYRGKLIALLGRVGDDETARTLVTRIDEFTPEEQVAVLEVAEEVGLPDRLSLARESLSSKSFIVRQAAIKMLAQNAGDAAVTHLAEALDGADHTEIEVICNALGRIGTTSARRKLEQYRSQAAREGNKDARMAAQIGLRIMMAQSPGWSSFEQASDRWRRQDWNGAEKYFSLAIEIDPELPIAHSGRGNVRLKKEEYGPAGVDFETAMRLDPYSVDAVTGRAIILAILGRPEQGIDLINETAERFPEDNIFAYNAACVYSRSVEFLKKQPVATERTELIRRHERLAIEQLRAAIEYGFDDFNWMGEDPDLVPLHGLEEFQTLLKSQPPG